MSLFPRIWINCIISSAHLLRSDPTKPIALLWVNVYYSARHRFILLKISYRGEHPHELEESERVFIADYASDNGYKRQPGLWPISDRAKYPIDRRRGGPH